MDADELGRGKLNGMGAGKGEVLDRGFWLTAEIEN